MTCENNCEICDVCGQEFDHEQDVFECEEELCPYTVGAIDPFAPLDFSREKDSLYVPEYIPEYNED